MLPNSKPSYTFGTSGTYTSGTPIDINPETLGNAESSYRFVEPIGGGVDPITDYVPKSTGGTFDAIIGYTTDLTASITANNHITNKKYVDDAISSAVGGTIDYSLARPYFSVANPTTSPLSYSSATGVYTLNRNLSKYANDVGYITTYTVTESDVTTHEAALTIYSSQIPDFAIGLSTNFNTLFDARFAASSLANLGTKTHQSLTSLPGSSEGYHLSLAQHTIVTQAADATHNGYLTLTDWGTFNSKLSTLTAGTGIIYASDIISAKPSEIDHNSLLNYSTTYHRSINDSATGVTDLWSASKIISYVSDANVAFTDITTNNASTSKHGFLPKLANDTSKYLRSDGAWIAIPVSGDFLDSVIRMVVDNGFDPSPLTNGDRYIVMNSGSIHANFGTINKMLDGSSRTLESNDIVQYISAAAEFRIAYDASTSTMPVTVTVGTDKNGASGHQWAYNITDDVWVDRGGIGATHNSFADLNTGVGQFYHLTSAQHDLVAGVTSTYTELNYLDGTVPTNTLLLFGDGTKITNNAAFYVNSGTGALTATTFVGNLTGNVTGSADKWTTARNLAGNSVDGSTNVAFSNKFIVQGTTDSGLTGAQFLGALSTGILKNTTTTGVLSIASAGTDYQPVLSLTSGYVPYATGTYILSNSGLRYDGTNFGFGTTPATYKVTVSGDINITTGSKYKINGSNLTYSDVGAQPLDATLTSLAGLSGVQGDIIYASGSDSYSVLNKSIGTNYYLKNSGTSNNPAWAGIGDGDLTLTDVTTNNSSSSKHGFLPKLANTGTKYLRDDGTWQTVTTNPGGSDTYVQFNDGGSTFGGDSGLTYNKTTDALTCVGVLTGSNVETNATSYTTRLGLNSGKNEDETVGRYSVFIGNESGYTCSTGYNIVAVGDSSCYSLTTGYDVTSVGKYSGYSLTTGKNHSLYGRSAGASITTKDYSTCMGYMSGGANDIGNAVYYGAYSGYRETADSKLFIDNQDRGSEAAARTGSMLYGVFNATVADQTLAINASTYTKRVVKAYQTLTSSTGITMNVRLGQNAKVTLAHNTTLTLSNLENGDEGNIVVTQDSTGSRTMAISPTPKVINGGGGTITLTSASNSIDILSYTYDGTNLYITKGPNYT